MYKISLLFLLLLLLSTGLNAQERDFHIIRYDIKVQVSSIYDYLSVEALMEIQHNSSSQDNPLEINLCKNFRGIDLRDIKVYDEKNIPLKYEFRNNMLKPQKDIKQGETEKLLLTYKIYPRKDPSDSYATFAFNISDTDCRINSSITRTDNWYPKIKGTDCKRLPPFKLSVDVPREFEVMASGRLYYISEIQGRKIYKWENYENITDRSLYFFARKCRKVEKACTDGFKVKLYVPFNSIDENVDYVANVIYKSYKYFEETFGATGLREYKAMAIPEGITGGYSGFFNSMTLGEGYFTKKIENNEILFPTRNVVHEVSHTWWGNIVSADASKDYWLFEGFAKFSEIIALKSVFDKDVETESFRRLKLIYMAYYGYDLPVIKASEIEEKDLQVAVAYYKGALILKSLELIMGEEAFFNGIKEYVKEYRSKVASTEDFRKVMQKSTSTDLNDFFRSYLDEKGMGKYSLSIMDSSKDGQDYITQFRIENKGNKNLYTLTGIKTYLEDYNKKVCINKDTMCFLDVRNTEPSNLSSIKFDKDEIYLVCEENLTGPGGYVYITPRGEVKFTGIIENTPLAKSGIKNSFTLLEIDGINCSGLNLVKVNRLLLKNRGTKVKLLIKTDKEKKEVEVTY
ncbi:MAG TPA: M1 family aminopeptidase [Candidatus Eremiobacteraeota bacterium]|nr:MAG: Aminopeptidase N [bacterium ADurb.Bin363]HPZ06609.1 M1 family aminopeptidase [Candidatus Eremiobacteraeota bacterium]